MPANRLDSRAVTVMFGLCVVWGVQQVATKVALEGGFAPIMQALLRSLIAAPLLLAWLLARRGTAGTAALLGRDGTLRPGLLIALGFAVEFVFLFEGMARIPASRAVVILYTAAFFTAFGTHLLVPGERLRAVNLLGFVLAFAGVAVTIGGGQGETSFAGDMLMLGAAAGWGLTTVVIKASRALAAAPAEKVLGYQVVGSIPILAAAAALEGRLAMPAATPLAWASLLYQSAGVTFASYLTWFWLIGRYPAGRLAAFSFLTPIFGVLAAAVLLHEPVTWSLLVGIAGVCAGLLLVNR